MRRVIFAVCLFFGVLSPVFGEESSSRCPDPGGVYFRWRHMAVKPVGPPLQMFDDLKAMIAPQKEGVVELFNKPWQKKAVEKWGFTYDDFDRMWLAVQQGEGANFQRLKIERCTLINGDMMYDDPPKVLERSVLTDWEDGQAKEAWVWQLDATRKIYFFIGCSNPVLEVYVPVAAIEPVVPAPTPPAPAPPPPPLQPQPERPCPPCPECPPVPQCDPGWSWGVIGEHMPKHSKAKKVVLKTDTFITFPQDAAIRQDIARAIIAADPEFFKRKVQFAAVLYNKCDTRVRLYWYREGWHWKEFILGAGIGAAAGSLLTYFLRDCPPVKGDFFNPGNLGRPFLAGDGVPAPDIAGEVGRRVGRLVSKVLN